MEKDSEFSLIKLSLNTKLLMLLQRFSKILATPWERLTTGLSQRPKLSSLQNSFSNVPQYCHNVNHDVVTTLSQSH